MCRGSRSLGYLLLGVGLGLLLSFLACSWCLRVLLGLGLLTLGYLLLGC